MAYSYFFIFIVLLTLSRHAGAVTFKDNDTTTTFDGNNTTAISNGNDTTAYFNVTDTKANFDGNDTTSLQPDDAFIDIYDPNVKVKDNEIVLALNLPFDNQCRSNDASVCRARRKDRAISPYHHGKYYASAASVAIQEINNRTDILPNHKLRYVWKSSETDTDCDQARAIKVMLKQLNMPNIHGFLGFACHCSTVASIASATNRPLFSKVRNVAFLLYSQYMFFYKHMENSIIA